MDNCPICFDAVDFGQGKFVHGSGKGGHRIHSACMVEWGERHPRNVTCPVCNLGVGTIQDVVNTIRTQASGLERGDQLSLFPRGLPRGVVFNPEASQAVWTHHRSERLSPEEQDRRARAAMEREQLTARAIQRERDEAPRRRAAAEAAAAQQELDARRELDIRSGLVDPRPRRPQQEGTLTLVTLGAIGVGGALTLIGPNFPGMVASSLIVFSICTWGDGRRGGTRRRKSLKRKRGGNICVTGEIDFRSTNPFNDFLSKVDKLKQNAGKQNVYTIEFDNIDLKTSNALITALDIKLDGPIHVSKI